MDYTENLQREQVEDISFWSWEKQFQGTLHIYGMWNYRSSHTEWFGMGEGDHSGLSKLECITEYIQSINIKRLRPQISDDQGESRDTL